MAKKPDSYWKETYEQRKNKALEAAGFAIAHLEESKKDALKKVDPEVMQNINQTISGSPMTVNKFVNQDLGEDVDNMTWEDGAKKGQPISDDEKQALDVVNMDRGIEYWKNIQAEWEQGKDLDKERDASSHDLSQIDDEPSIGAGPTGLSGSRSHVEANESQGGTADAYTKMLEASERFTNELWGGVKAMMGSPRATPNPQSDLNVSAKALPQPSDTQPKPEPQNEDINENIHRAGPSS